MPNCPQNVIAFYAVLRLGATVVEHNPLYTVGELHLPFVDHAARVAIVWDKVVPVVEQVRAGSALEHVVAVDLTAELPLAKRLALRLPLAKARAARDQLTTPAPGCTAPGAAWSPPRRSTSRTRARSPTTSPCSSTPRAPPAPRRACR